MRKTICKIMAVIMAVTCLGCSSAKDIVNDSTIATEKQTMNETTETETMQVEPISFKTDVVVVGAGGAGMSAAIAAAESGADVIILEKTPSVGGSTCLSGGEFIGYDENIDDVNEEKVNELIDFWMSRSEDNANPELVKTVAENSNGIAKWLASYDLVISRNTKTHKGHTFGSFHASFVTKDGKELAGAGALSAGMEEAMEKLGVQILYETPAIELITNQANEVCGVKAQNSLGNEIEIEAKSVVLATGGFALNSDKLDELDPGLRSLIFTANGAGNTGDGIAMAEAVGAATEYHDNIMFGAQMSADMVCFPMSDTGDMGVPALLVTNKGERFCNEADNYYTVFAAMLEEIHKGCSDFYMIVDQNAYAGAGLGAYENGNAVMAETLDELASLLDIDAETLKATAERYTELKGKEDIDFGKDATLMTGISDGPFYAVKVLPFALGTIGGLVINEEMQILDASGNAIPNLYGAGELVNGAFFYNEYFASGSAVQYSLGTGRLAGMNASK